MPLGLACLHVLTIAGSDSSGGAGIQADIRAIAALGALAATAVTAITVQDIRQVHQVYSLPPALVAAQIACVLANPGVQAVKTGMLVDAPTIAAVAAVLRAEAVGIPLVIDPVLAATSGYALLDPAALSALRALLPLATLITPNALEAAMLSGRAVETLDDMRAAADLLRADGAAAVLIKGGHVAGDPITDLLVTGSGEQIYAHPRRPGPARRGTGCTLASAIATFLAQGQPLAEAVGAGIDYLQHVMRGGGVAPEALALLV